MLKLQTTIRALCAGAILATAAADAAYAESQQAWLELVLPDSNGQFAGTGGMNSSNTITGYYSKTDGSWAGFVRTADGTVTTFVPDGGASGTVTTSINAGGTVVGYINGGAQGFERTPDGQITNLGNGVIPTSINDRGVIAGSAYINNRYRGFVLTPDGNMDSFLSPDGSTNDVVGINNKGVVAGYYGDGSYAIPYIRSRYGKVTTFTIPTATRIFPVGINKDNDIAGWWLNGNARHGFLRHADGTIVTFDEPDAVSGGTMVSAINNDGVIVGTYTGSTTSHGYARSPSGAFVTLTEPKAVRGTHIDHVAPDGKMTGLYIDLGNNEHLVRANEALTGF